MSSNIKMLKPILAELTVDVSKEDVTKAIEKAYATLSRTAQVRGFRKGKVPRAVLQRLYGEAILQEVRGDIVNNHLFTALIENKLDPISQPQIDIPNLKKGEDFSFKATFEVRPTVDKVDYSGIEVEKLKVSVSDEDVSQELERIRGSLASVSDLSEPRPAAKGDVAIIALKRWEDGEWKESSGLPEQEVVVGEGQAPEQIDDAIVGMSIDEEKVVNMGTAGTEGEESQIRYMLSLKALKERKLPEVDDELAKDTGKYDSLDALKADIEKHIVEMRERHENQRLRGALFAKLLEKNPMELPPSLVERHAQAMKQQLVGQFMSQMNEEQSAAMLKGLEEGTRKSAEEAVHQHLLSLEIARIENISVSDEDIDKEIEERATAAGIPVPMLKAELNKENRRQEFSHEILERKIFDFVKSSVKIIDVDTLSEPAEDEAASDEPDTDDEVSTKTDETVKDDASDTKEETRTVKTATKKTAAKKSVTKKTTAKKTDTKKSAAKKTTAKKTATTKTSAKKTAAKKAAVKES